MSSQSRTAFEQNNTIAGLLTSRAAAFGTVPFLSFEGHEWSYGETLRQAQVFAQALMVAGVRREDRVAMMVENRLEFFAAWFGTALAGAVHVPINLEYRGDILGHVLGDVAPRIMVCEDYLLPVLASAADGIDRGIETIVVLASSAGRSAAPDLDRLPWRIIAWPEFVAAPSGALQEFRRRAPSDLGSILLTSGTTGVSKGVMVSDKHAITHGREAAEAYGIRAGDVMYTCLPLFHGNAQWSTVLAALHSGARVALSRRFSASRFWTEVTLAGATQIALLGTMLHILIAQPIHPDETRHRVRVANSVPCPLDVMIAFERRFGIQLLETYGGTETKRILSNRHYHRRPGSAGYPTPSSIVEIHDEAGWRVPAGVVGEIVYRPKEPGILTLGYLNRPDATLAMLRDGWWCTGDLAWQDADGFVYFAGRKKDALRRRGENVSAFEVERALMTHPAVLLAAVVAAPSALSEDEILAAVVLAKDAAASETEIFAHADASLPYFMVPRYIALVDSLPETPTGKIAKEGLADRLMERGVWDSVALGLTASRSSDLARS
jgi:crotonobetaine/carnitine-CoA ligase